MTMEATCDVNPQICEIQDTLHCNRKKQTNIKIKPHHLLTIIIIALFILLIIHIRQYMSNGNSLFFIKLLLCGYTY